MIIGRKTIKENMGMIDKSPSLPITEQSYDAEVKRHLLKNRATRRVQSNIIQVIFLDFSFSLPPPPGFLYLKI